MHSDGYLPGARAAVKQGVRNPIASHRSPNLEILRQARPLGAQQVKDQESRTPTNLIWARPDTKIVRYTTNFLPDCYCGCAIYSIVKAGRNDATILNSSSVYARSTKSYADQSALRTGFTASTFRS